MKHKFSFHVGRITCCGLKLILKITCIFSQWSVILDCTTSDCERNVLEFFHRKSLVQLFKNIFINECGLEFP